MKKLESQLTNISRMC